MEISDIEDDGCPYRNACVDIGIELTETCITPKHKRCLEFQKYEEEKRAYVFDRRL